MTTEPTGNLAESAPKPMGPGEMLFSFEGRAPRSAYLIFAAICLVVWMIAKVAAGPNGDPRAEVLAIFILLWPALAIQIKRLHDRDKSGWWILIALIPIIGHIWLFIELGFLPGTPGPNRFGPPTGRF